MTSSALKILVGGVVGFGGIGGLTLETPNDAVEMGEMIVPSYGSCGLSNIVSLFRLEIC